MVPTGKPQLCTYTYVHIYIYIHTYMYIRDMHIYTFISTYIHIHIQIYVHVCIYAGVYVYVYVYIYDESLVNMACSSGMSDRQVSWMYRGTTTKASCHDSELLSMNCGLL